MVNSLRRSVLRNFGLKLMSLILAIGLWLAVSHDPPAEVEHSVPIEFLHFPDNLEMASESVPQARVRLRGPERLIHGVRPTDIHVEIDLTGTKAGERTFDLTAQQVREPRDLKVVQIVPGQFRTAFDTRLTRQVEVRPRVIGNFAPGLRIARVVADPAVIAITGPRQRVEAVETAMTDPIDATGDVDRATFTSQAYVSDPLIQVVHPGPIRVTVIMEKAPSSSGGL